MGKTILKVPTRVFSEQSTEKIWMTGKNGKKYEIRANHPVAQRKRNRIQKAAIKEVWKSQPRNITFPCKVTLIRSGHAEMDYVNFVYSLKYIQDAVAECLRPGLATGRADGKNMGITWDFKQEKGVYAITVEIEDAS